MTESLVGVVPERRFRLGFVFVGPQRTGTTWFHEYLARCSDVVVPTKLKETFFFDRHHDKGLAWYASHFREVAHHARTGEVAPTYFHASEAPARIAAVNPHCRIVVTLREPVGRLVSLYHHEQRYGMIPVQEGLLRALDTYPELLESSRYATHCRRWRDQFGAANVLIVLMEDLASQPETVVRDVCRFLRVERVPIPPALAGPVNTGRRPYNYAVSRSASRTATWLRTHGMHALINGGKRLGLKNLLIGDVPVESTASEVEAREILARLRLEIAALETGFGLDLTRWRRSWPREVQTAAQ
jgi:hypothetical protein